MLLHYLFYSLLLSLVGWFLPFSLLGQMGYWKWLPLINEYLKGDDYYNWSKVFFDGQDLFKTYGYLPIWQVSRLLNLTPLQTINFSVITFVSLIHFHAHSIYFFWKKKFGILDFYFLLLSVWTFPFLSIFLFKGELESAFAILPWMVFISVFLNVNFLSATVGFISLYLAFSISGISFLHGWYCSPLIFLILRKENIRSQLNLKLFFLFLSLVMLTWMYFSGMVPAYKAGWKYSVFDPYASELTVFSSLLITVGLFLQLPVSRGLKLAITVPFLLAIFTASLRILHFWPLGLLGLLALLLIFSREEWDFRIQTYIAPSIIFGYMLLTSDEVIGPICLILAFPFLQFIRPGVSRQSAYLCLLMTFIIFQRSIFSALITDHQSFKESQILMKKVQRQLPLKHGIVHFVGHEQEKKFLVGVARMNGLRTLEGCGEYSLNPTETIRTSEPCLFFNTSKDALKTLGIDYVIRLEAIK